MSWADDFRADMEPVPAMPPIDVLAIDDSTADRLLAGQVRPDDAPPEYRAVAGLVAALTTAASTPASGDATAVVAAMRTASAARTRRSGVKRRMQLVTAGALGGALLLGGLAGAGALPGAAQGVAADALATDGVNVPDPNAASGGHADARGQSDDPESTSETPDDPAGGAPSDTKGSTISDLAHTTDATGVDKGAEISSVASDGHSQAGVNGPPTTLAGTGGSGTGDEASGGAASGGTTNAGDASGGHSTAGSGNADTGLTHRP